MVVLEQRFERDCDGHIWAPGAFGDVFWRRYLRVFDRVRVLARLRVVSTPSSHFERLSASRVSFEEVGDFSGALGYGLAHRRLRRVSSRALARTEAVILRVPSSLAMVLHGQLRRSDRPYAVEVVGDVAEVFARSALRHPLRPVLRRWLASAQRRHCASATAAAYVSGGLLKARYPVSAQGDVVAPRARAHPFVTTYSSVELGDEWFETCHSRETARALQLVTVGSLARPYKGVDVLLRAVAICVDRGLDVRLAIVGDGRCRTDLEALSMTLRLTSRVEFAGNVSAGGAVRRYLSASDLFVLASRTEGLPRAMLEAMAMGLPCVGSAVGGIPELLDRDALVSPESPEELAAKIMEISGAPARMRAMSEKNRHTALQYHASTLTTRRDTFFEFVRSTTEAWKASTLPGQA